MACPSWGEREEVWRHRGIWLIVLEIRKERCYRRNPEPRGKTYYLLAPMEGNKGEKTWYKQTLVKK